MPQEKGSSGGLLVLGAVVLGGLYLLSQQQQTGPSGDLFGGGGGGGAGGSAGVGTGSGSGDSSFPGLQIPPGGIPPGGLPQVKGSTIPNPAAPTLLGTPIPYITIGLGPLGNQKIPIVPPPVTGINRTAVATVTDWLTHAGLKAQLGSGTELQIQNTAQNRAFYATDPRIRFLQSPIAKGLAQNPIGQFALQLQGNAFGLPIQSLVNGIQNPPPPVSTPHGSGGQSNLHGPRPPPVDTNYQDAAQRRGNRPFLRIM